MDSTSSTSDNQQSPDHARAMVIENRWGAVRFARYNISSERVNNMRVRSEETSRPKVIPFRALKSTNGFRYFDMSLNVTLRIGRALCESFFSKEVHFSPRSPDSRM